MSATNQTVLKIKNVTKAYDSKHGIFDINLSVKKGEVFGFLGPNGAGKSTTINTVLGLLRQDSGSISILGKDNFANLKEAHARIGYVSGDMETDPSLRGKQYLRFVAHLRGVKDIEGTVGPLVKRLRADTTTKIKHLSRGNKQKIGLIAALMHNPDLLILDEPTSGLDPLIQAEFNAIIREFRDQGKTTFISSHILSEVQAICDRIGFIRGGKLIDVSTLDEIMSRASRRVFVSFAGQSPAKKIEKLAGVSKIATNDGTLSFDFNGDINALVALLAAHRLKSLEFAEADLESLFMHYYQEGAN